MEVHSQQSRKGCRLGCGPDTRNWARKDAAIQAIAVQARNTQPSSLLLLFMLLGGVEQSD
jgi:hypothetical protein